MTTPATGRPLRPRLVRWAILLAVWLVVAVLVGSALFLNSSRTTALAGHDAEVHPTLDGHASLSTGPVLPDVRMPLDVPLGVEIVLGKTEVESTEELFSRYALIASNSEAQAAKVRDVVVEMALASALRGLAAGAVPVLLYLILGPVRRREMWEEVRTLRPRPLLAVVLVGAVGLSLWQPWSGEEPEISNAREWIPLAEFLGDEVPVPPEARTIQVRVDTTSTGTRRLIGSALDTYSKSQVFYDTAAQQAGELELREPGEDETVVLLVSDRHDNVGMDRVARAVAERAGANAIFGGGDDTSTGAAWEAFSLDSLDETFNDFDRWFVTGNHDHGAFVPDHLNDRDWTELTGDVVEGPAGGTLLGIPDPRSSGLGNWRDEVDMTFAEATELVAERACAAEERVNTILVHDANLAKKALEQGCADLAVGGHTHVQSGPTLFESPEGDLGYSWTNGTTGGAAYAIAVGSKPRRDAQVTLITYDATGRPVGLQWVTLQTTGVFKVGDFAELEFPSAV
ncbi:metallophosphoesterase [Nocardioides gilvus]|uniref:metallophosphoesterase n=1 Tax=Nocardioides gilvus TaxID=1735589 RepID=UPI001EF6AA03|nr:metallophosphoesterase [Nocardioides gilvus]